MNSESMHLVSDITKLPDRTGYDLLPIELQHAARAKLAGRAEAHVSRRSKGKLARWAAKQRKQQRASRQRNTCAR